MSFEKYTKNFEFSSWLGSEPIGSCLHLFSINSRKFVWYLDKTKILKYVSIYIFEPKNMFNLSERIFQYFSNFSKRCLDVSFCSKFHRSSSVMVRLFPFMINLFDRNLIVVVVVEISSGLNRLMFTWLSTNELTTKVPKLHFEDKISNIYISN